MVDKEELGDKKARMEQGMLSNSFQRMASLLSLEKSQLYFQNNENPLYAACRVIGKASAIHFSMPKLPLDEEGDSVRQFLDSICSNSKVRYRQVILLGEWWESLSSPLLAFYGSDYNPVALIPQREGTCIMVDSERGNAVLVDEGVAGALIPQAYSFYESLPTKMTSLKNLFTFGLKGVLWDVSLIALVGFFATLATLLFPFANQLLFDVVIPDVEISLFWQLAGGVLIVTLSSVAFTLVQSLTVLRLEGIVESRVQAGLWDRLLRIPVSFFQGFSSGDLYQRVAIVEEARKVLSSQSISVLLSGVFSLLYLFTMFYFSWKLALLGLGIQFVGILVALVCVYIKIPLVRKSLEINGKINGYLIQMIGGITKLRIAGAEKRAFCHWANEFVEGERQQLRIHKVDNILSAFITFLPSLTMALIFFFAIYLLEAGRSIGEVVGMTTGTFLAFLSSYGPFSQALWKMTDTAVSLCLLLPLWERASVVLEEPVEEGEEKEKPCLMKGEVELNNICFRYQEGEPFLHRNLSLSARQGEFVGIVGPSGSGKSTLLRMLVGFEVPQSGKVTYDGFDLSGLKPSQLRKQLGVVLQSTQVFSGTVFENITCGRNCSPEKIQLAISLSRLDKVLEKLPMGLDTVLNSGGETFSGGERQRLLLARAMVMEPRVLILDEATSTLDSQTQDEVMQFLNDLQITRIVVAHRLSTLKKADTIYVLGEGKIAQSGSFQKLSQEDGYFKDTLAKQIFHS